MTGQTQVDLGKRFRRLLDNGGNVSDIAMFSRLTRRQVWDAINASHAAERETWSLIDDRLRLEIEAGRREIAQADKAYSERQGRCSISEP